MCSFYFRTKCCPSRAGALSGPDSGAGRPEPGPQPLDGLSSRPGPRQGRRGSPSEPPFRLPRRVRVLFRALPPTPSATSASAAGPTLGAGLPFPPSSTKQKLGILGGSRMPRSGDATLRGTGGRSEGQQRLELSLGSAPQVLD